MPVHTVRTSPRLGFATCVELGQQSLEELIDIGFPPTLVITLRDDVGVTKSGRVFLDTLCDQHSIPLEKTRNINDPECLSLIHEADLDWLFIVGWSQIAGEGVISAARYGTLGIHPTLLPQGRGRASIPWAILKELPQTGATLFKLDSGVDSGPIVSQEIIPVEPHESATSLYAKVTAAHRALIRDSVPRLLAGVITPAPQDESLATYWPGRKPADGLILPSHTVMEADRMVRAVTQPYPGAIWRTGRQSYRIWRGLPIPEPSTAKSTLTLELADGFFEATEYSLET